MAMGDDSPSFWAFAIPPGGTLVQQVPPDASVCLTGVVLGVAASDNGGKRSSPPRRVVVSAECGGYKAVLCNLFGSDGHQYARLGQPFQTDFILSVSAGAAADVHVSGFYRGDIGPAEVLGAKGVKMHGEEASAAATKKQQPAAAAGNASGRGDAASRAKADMQASAKMGIGGEDDDDEDDEDADEDSEEEESGEEGEEGDLDEEDGGEEDDEEDEDEDGEEDDDDSEDDEAAEGDMPLAPQSVADILKLGKKRPAGSADAPAAAKAAKPSVAPAAAPPPKPVIGAPPPKPSAPAAPPKPATRTLGGGLQVTDERMGSGAMATSGRKVHVRYSGTLTSGKRFDAGTIDFRLGAGEVIKGWDEGVKGMKVGGKRKLKIPPHLAYGKRGAPPTIPPNATLLFDVELLRC